MKSNRTMWIFVAVVVLTTIAITLGTQDSQSQQKTIDKTQPSPTLNNRFGDLSKYAVVGYDDPESLTEAEYQQRIIKNKRYDVSLPVAKNPHPDDFAITGSDIERVPPAIPHAESNLVIIGEILTSKALLSNSKKGIYTEFSVSVCSVLKEDNQKKIQVDEKIDIDRAGGIVRYQSGQKVLYLIAWQKMPEVGGRYVFFLTTDDIKNPNYKILTGYQISGGKMTALDNPLDFNKFNGMSETDFTKLVLGKK